MRIGVVYRENGNSEKVDKSILATSAECIQLRQVKSSVVQYDENDKVLACYLDGNMVKAEYAKKIIAQGYKNSNIEEVMEGIDALLFSGGCDVSPTFYKNVCELANGNERICAERDISDYLCMQYALDKNIPTLCICRGMQVLAIVSGCDMIQHIDDYYVQNGFEYDYVHRQKERETYQRHDIEITDNNSIIGKLFKDKIIQNYSWHHQAVVKFDDIENLKITGVYNDGKIEIVEAIERTDKDFCVGLQFHPERAIDADGTLQQDDCMKIFKALFIEAQRRRK